MATQIKSISFLDTKDKRRRAHADMNGTFPVMVSGTGTVRDYRTRLTAKELVARVFDGDPVLELIDRSRMRVRQGGTGKMRVDAECAIISHDEYYRDK